MSPSEMKITGLMAKEAPIAVLFCRRPHKWTRMIRWNTTDDTFERGQYVKGRVRIQCADISPDGTKVVYEQCRYLPDHNQRNITAISRPPYFTALACWTGMGGGRFRSNYVVNLDGHPSYMNLINGEIPLNFNVSMERSESSDFAWNWQPDDQRFYGTEPLPSELYDRILQDRRAIVEWVDSKTPKFPFLAVPEIRRKRGSHFDLEIHIAWNKREFERGEAPLRRVIVGRFVCRDGNQTSLEEATWADVDQLGRIVFARNGIVYTIDAGATGEPVDRPLADFSQDRFEEVIAPEWATK